MGSSLSDRHGAAEKRLQQQRHSGNFEVVHMTEFDPDKFREAIYRAKVYVYATSSKDPKKQKILNAMKLMIDQLQQLCDELLD